MAKSAKRNKKRSASQQKFAPVQGHDPQQRGSLPQQMRTAREQIDAESSSNPWLLISALVATALFMFVYYHLMALQQMSQLADGIAMLDQRFFGYGTEAVRELSAAMDEKALGQLNWTHKTAGVIFPIVFGIAAASVIAMVVPSGGRKTVFTGTPARVTLWSMIGIFVIVDIAENILIETILRNPDSELVGISAALTVGRWVLLVLVVGYSVIAFGASKVRNFSQTAGGAQS